MSYTLDSNILIGLQRRYPRDIFPGLWESVEESVATGQSCICEAILREVKRGGDSLHSWAKSLPDFVCSATGSEMATVGEISRAHPGWVREQTNEADPFIIAHAKHENSILVTEETRKGPGTADRNQKIPNVADEHSVHTINFFAYVRANGWSFRS